MQRTVSNSAQFRDQRIWKCTDMMYDLGTEDKELVLHRLSIIMQWYLARLRYIQLG